MAGTPDAEGGDPAPKQFGNYEILELLGHAGGARIYQARQVTLGRLVTLTVLPPQEADKAAYHTRFMRQMAVASKLRHPNIISAIEAGDEGGYRYIASEYAGGRRLSTALVGREWFPIRRCVAIALEIARGLAYMESQGFVHRDITPEAILLAESGIAKLRGFSFSKEQGASPNETWFDTDAYSALYKGPDAMSSDDHLDTRTDIYSLGCVLYEMVTGHPPFPGTNAAVVLERHVRDEVPDPAALRKDLPDSLGHVLAQCLKKKRDERYATASLLVTALEAIQAGKPVAPPPVRSKRRRWRRGRS